MASRHTYVGITNNLPRRLRQHNGELTGGAKYTRGRRPWAVAGFVSGFQSHQEALMFEWAWRHASKRSGGGVDGRRNKLREILNRERWTSRSPPAADVPLTLHWVPQPDGGSGSELVLGSPLRLEVTEVVEQENGVEAWSANADPKDSGESRRKAEDDGKDTDDENEANETESSAHTVTEAKSSQHYANAWVQAETEWAALEAGLEAPLERTQAQAQQANQNGPDTRNLPAAAIHLTGGHRRCLWPSVAEAGGAEEPRKQKRAKLA